MQFPPRLAVTVHPNRTLYSNPLAILGKTGEMEVFRAQESWVADTMCAIQIPCASRLPDSYLIDLDVDRRESIRRDSRRPYQSSNGGCRADVGGQPARDAVAFEEFGRDVCDCLVPEMQRIIGQES